MTSRDFSVTYLILKSNGTRTKKLWEVGAGDALLPEE